MLTFTRLVPLTPRTLLLPWVALTLAACSREEKPESAQASASQAARASMAEGNARLIYQRRCARCHGAQGMGDGPMGAGSPPATDFTDQDVMAKLSDARLTTVIEAGGRAAGLSPRMPAFGQQMSKEEIASVVKYLRTFAGPRSP